MVDNAPSEGSLRAALNTTPTPTPTPHPTITTIRSSCSTSSASTSSAGADKNDNSNSNGINENVVEPLRCGICQEYVTNNVGCNACGKLYCQECLNLWFKTKRGSAKCPNCAQSSKFSHVIVAQRMADAILEPCPNECGASIPRGDLELHKAIHCPKTEETCPYCDLRDLREKIEVHEKECLNRPQNPEGEGRRKGKDVLMHHRRNGGGRIFFPHDDGAGAGAGAGAGGARGGGRFRRILESTKAVFIATLLLTAFFTVLVAFMFFHYHREQQERQLTIKRVLDCGLVSLVAPIVMASPTVRSEMGGEVFVPQRGSILIDASYSIINLNNGNGNNGNYQNHTVRYRQKITRKHEQETNEEKQLRRTKRILEGRFKIGDPVDIRSKFSDHLLNTYVSSFFFKPPGGVGFGWWYPATVLDVVESSPSTTSNKNKGTRIRVHYTGYPFKDDEWLDLNSPADRSRIAPAYTHVPKTTATGTTTTTTAASARQHHHYSDSGEYEVFAWAIVNNDNNNNKKKEGSSPAEDFQWHISKIRVTLHPSSAPKMGTTTSHQSPQGSSSRPSSSFLSSLASSAGMVIASEYGGGGSRSGSGEVKEIEIKVDDRLRIVDEVVVEKQQHHHPYHYYHHTYSNSDKKNMEENKQQQQQQRHHLRPYFRRFDIDFDDGNYDEDEDAGMGMGGGGFYDGDFELWMTDPNFALGSLLREMSGVVELPKAVHIALSIIVWLVLFWCGYTVWCLI